MGVTQVHSVLLFVADLPRSLEHYKTLLDIEPVEQSESLVAFQIGGTQLLLHADGGSERVPAGTDRGAGVSIHIQVEDIEAHWSRLNKLGVPLEEKPTKQPWGFVEFAVKDPDGYEVELLEPV